MEELQNSRVLITGGAGFIGSEVARQIAAHGGRVVIVDNLVNGKRENVKDILSDHVTLEVCDIRNESVMPQLMEGIDIIFHLACLGVRHSIHSPQENHDVNATATLRLLEWARERKVRRYVYVSTSEVYGCLHPIPPIPEAYPTFPLTVYGASKLAAECYVRAYYMTYGYPTVVLRPFNTYGPRCHHEGDSGEVIPKFMLRCMAGRPMIIFDDGTQSRDFTYVSDTASGIIAAGSSDEVIGITINLGSGRSISINDLAREVVEVVGNPDAKIVHDAPRPGDVFHLCADTTRARELLGFEPRVSFREGLARLRDWYKASPQSPAEMLELEKVRSWERNGMFVGF